MRDEKTHVDGVGVFWSHVVTGNDAGQLLTEPNPMKTETETNSARFWAAPASVAALRQNGGASSWSVVRSSQRPAFWLAQPLSHEPAAFAGIRLGRTPGRALRNTRRFLAANPTAFE